MKKAIIFLLILSSLSYSKGMARTTTHVHISRPTVRSTPKVVRVKPATMKTHKTVYSNPVAVKPFSATPKSSESFLNNFTNFWIFKNLLENNDDDKKDKKHQVKKENIINKK